MMSTIRGLLGLAYSKALSCCHQYHQLSPPRSTGIDHLSEGFSPFKRDDFPCTPWWFCCSSCSLECHMPNRQLVPSSVEVSMSDTLALISANQSHYETSIRTRSQSVAAQVRVHATGLRPPIIRAPVEDIAL